MIRHIYKSLQIGKTVDRRQSVPDDLDMPHQTSAKSALNQISQRRSKTLNTIVREAIEEMITSGELEPGERINESNLATRLDVSRGPIREACRSLEQAGLLVSAVNHGVYVRDMTLDEVRNLYEVRGALACLAGRLIVQRASDQEVDGLKQLVEEMDKAAMKEDLQAYFSLNLRFHDALVAAAHNPSLEQSYRWIINQLHLYRRRGLVQSGNLKVSNEEHKVILKAILARDESKAEDAMRQHVGGGWSRMSASV